MPEIITGNEIIDSLQGLQRVADGIPSTDRKIAHIRNGIHLLGAHRLLGHPLMIGTSLAFGRDADMPPDSAIVYKDGLLLTGQLDIYDFLINYPNIESDSLALGVETPHLFVGDPTDTNPEDFSKQTLRIPILAIDTCVSLDLE